MPSSNEIKQQNVLFDDQRDILNEITGLMDNATKSSEDLTKSLSGVADLFGQIKADAEKLPDDLKKGNKEALTFAKALDKAKGKTKDLAKGLVAAGKQVASTMTSAFGDIADILQNVLSLSIVGTFGALFATIVSKFDYAFKQVVNELGIGFKVVGTEADNVNTSFENLRQNIVASGLEFKDVVGSSRQLADNFGVGMSTSADLAFNISDGAKALGVQSNTMATLVGQFSLVGDMSADQAHLLSEQVGLLAAQNDVAPAAVLEDMAGSTEEMALFSKGGVKNFAKTAIEARKLGMSVKDVANTLKGMLNFEDSLNKELQASVMLGKNINLNEARRLSFAGDTAGAFQAIANELGDVDLGSLDPLTLQSVADAAGMSTEQLLKMSKGADEMGGVDMGEEALSAQDVAALKARDTMTKMEQTLADMNNIALDLADTFGGPIVDGLSAIAGYLKDFMASDTFKNMEESFKKLVKLMQEGNWHEVGKMIGNGIWEGLKAAWNIFWPTFTGLAGAGFEALSDSTLGAFLKPIGVVTMAAGTGFGKLGKTIKSVITGPFKLAGMASNKLKKKLGFGKVFDDNAKRWRTSTGKFAKAPKGAALMDKLFNNKMAKNVKNTTKNLAKVGKPVAKFFGTFGKLGRGVPLLGQALTIFDGVSGAIKAYDKDAGILKNSFNVVGGAVKGVADGLATSVTGIVDFFLPGSPLTDGYENMKTGISNAFSSAKDSVVGFFSGAKDGIAEKLSGVGTAIADKFKDVKTKVSKKLGDMGEAISTAWGDTTEWFGKQKNNIVEFFTKGEDGSNLGDKISGAVSGIYKKMETAWDNTTTWFGEQKDAIVDYFGEEGTLGNKIASAFSGIKDGITKAWGATTTWFGEQRDTMQEFFTKGEDGKGFVENVSEKFSGLKTAIKDKVQIGKDFFSGMFDKAVTGAATVKDKVASGFSGMSQAIQTKTKGVGEKLGSIFSGIGDRIKGMFPDIDFAGLGSDFAQGAQKGFNKAIEVVKKPFNLVIGAYNKVKSAISNVVLLKKRTLFDKGSLANSNSSYPAYAIYQAIGDFPPFDFGIPQIKTPNFGDPIPLLARGGQVTKTGTAIVEEGEVVSGLKGEALQPVADEIATLKSDIAQTNMLLSRILSEGIPVTKGI